MNTNSNIKNDVILPFDITFSYRGDSFKRKGPESGRGLLTAVLVVSAVTEESSFEFGKDMQ